MIERDLTEASQLHVKAMQILMNKHGPNGFYTIREEKEWNDVKMLVSEPSNT